MGGLTALLLYHFSLYNKGFFKGVKPKDDDERYSDEEFQTKGKLLDGSKGEYQMLFIIALSLTCIKTIITTMNRVFAAGFIELGIVVMSYENLLMVACFAGALRSEPWVGN